MGATFKRVNVDVIKKYMLPMPPKAEQVAITAYSRAAITKFETVEQTVSSSIALLTEYRSGLVTSAVTGKIAGLQ